MISVGKDSEKNNSSKLFNSCLQLLFLRTFCLKSVYSPFAPCMCRLWKLYVPGGCENCLLTVADR